MALIAQQIDVTARDVMRNNDPPRWLLDLVKRWRNDKTAVVTLNYDTFVEATLEAVISGRDENRGELDTGTISINPELIPLDQTVSIPAGGPPQRLGGSRTGRSQNVALQAAWIDSLVLGRSDTVYRLHDRHRSGVRLIRQPASCC